MNKLNRSLLLCLSAISIIFGAIFATNFPFNSWFTGWDNLHPEFNFFLNFSRGISAVWQENQGLGTYGGHGYAATLPHTLATFLMSLLIPIQYIRAIFTFQMLLIGSIGVFFLVRKLLDDKKENQRNNSALVGSLFYMLNLGTIQQFFIQLEAFIIHFAILPWLFYTLIRYLENKTKKNLLLFLAVTLASTAQGFIPPLFAVYFLLLLVFLAFYVINKPTSQRIKTSLFILLLTLLINAYWLLPVGYYSLTHSTTYLNSYNNLSSTEDFILKNKKYGNFTDAILLKGFIFEAIDGNQDGKIFLIFNQWTDHLGKKAVKDIGYLFFGIIILGAISLVKNKNKYVNLAIFSSLIISFSFLATNTYPFSLVADGFEKIPILKQAFRVAFTKFSIATAFFYAIAIGMGISTILSAIKRNSNLLILIPITLLVYFSLPSFKGNFLYSRTKVNIPDNYFQLFKFFNNHSKARIANLPQGWNWGWSIYRWGYSGSGFLWYGISQPIMDRSFDAWGSTNENYYWEMYYAIFSENFHIIDKLMDKYQISWVILDKNIVSYLNTQEYLYLQKTEEYLDYSDKFNLVKTFKSSNPKVRDIKLYTVKLNNPSRNFKQLITQQNDFKNIGPSYKFTNYDSAYQKYKGYYTDPTIEYDTYFPFTSLFTNRKPQEMAIDIQEDGPNITFKAKIPENLRGYSLIVPPIDPNFDLENPNIYVNKDNLIVSIPKNKITIYESKNDLHFLNPKAYDCQTIDSYKDIEQKILEDSVLRFVSKDAHNCHDIIFNQLGERFSYLVSLESKHVEGRQLELAVINHQTKSPNIDILLPDKSSFIKSYVILPPMKYYGLGYSLNFNNISIGNIKTTNDIKNVFIYRIPFYFLKHIELLGSNKKQPHNNFVFAFYQSYDPSWKAYELKNNNWLTSTFPFFFGKELKEHVLVNNWANGWKVNASKYDSKNTRFAVIFPPQYFEYVGFVLLGGTLFYLIVFYREKFDNGDNNMVDFLEYNKK